ncbi:molybdate ABC transporter substrate-binding protein [Halalkalibacter urbisdiaboli]|uniref:molybdate ABC transporter substrate-binding protein n=1 Tax=Halalkalibacter urbisdiaboli TaxID=1960589 RepID=UPI001FDA5BE7|nr:molybdate ABC transporter substrate-binding protein [Halalkalibacter urbisdiaboli]
MKHYPLLLLFFIVMLLIGCTDQNDKTELHIMVAASLTGAMNELIAEYETIDPTIKITPNYGSSGQLKTQITQGAPADIFLPAAVRWVEQLDGANPNVALLRNQLVLITDKDNNTIYNFDDLQKSQVKHIAIGLPEMVPAGEYAKQTLEYTGLYEIIENKLVFASDVRQVLTYVETGNVDAGIVYVTDALQSEAVDIRSTAPEDSHEFIIYPLALLESSMYPDEAEQFFNWLQTPAAFNIFKKYGFQGM